MRLILHGGSVLRARCSFFSLVNDDHENPSIWWSSIGLPRSFTDPGSLLQGEAPAADYLGDPASLTISDAKSPEETK